MEPTSSSSKRNRVPEARILLESQKLPEKQVRKIKTSTHSNRRNRQSAGRLLQPHLRNRESQIFWPCALIFGGLITFGGLVFLALLYNRAPDAAAHNALPNNHTLDEPLMPMPNGSLPPEMYDEIPSHHYNDYNVSPERPLTTSKSHPTPPSSYAGDTVKIYKTLRYMLHYFFKEHAPDTSIYRIRQIIENIMSGSFSIENIPLCPTGMDARNLSTANRALLEGVPEHLKNVCQAPNLARVFEALNKNLPPLAAGQRSHIYPNIRNATHNYHIKDIRPEATSIYLERIEEANKKIAQKENYLLPLDGCLIAKRDWDFHYNG